MVYKNYYCRMLIVIICSNSVLVNSTEIEGLKKCQRQCQSTQYRGQLQLCLLECYQSYSYIMYRTSRTQDSHPNSEDQLHVRRPFKKDDQTEDIEDDGKEKTSAFMKLGKSREIFLRFANPFFRKEHSEKEREPSRSLEDYHNSSSPKSRDYYNDDGDGDDDDDGDVYSDDKINRFSGQYSNDRSLTRALENMIQCFETINRGILRRKRNKESPGKDLGKLRSGSMKIGKWMKYSDGEINNHRKM